jgi:hypothetical protein
MDWLRRLFGRDEPADMMEARQGDQPGQVVEPDEGDPRGGMGAEAYNTADPRDIVDEEGVAMSGPAGAPQEGTTPDERRAEQRDE